MGIPVEFNSVLALREPKTAKRMSMECLPESPQLGENYGFIKSGYRIYPIGQEIPLIVTEGEQRFSRTIGQVIIYYVAVTWNVNEQDSLFPNQKYPIQTAGSYRIVSLQSETQA